jgi:DNA-3-methyladenine glycosylase II
MRRLIHQLSSRHEFRTQPARQADMTKHSHIHTEADLEAALAALGKAEPRFVALTAENGRPPLRRRQDGFTGLAAIIVAQQLSTASANAIWGRLAAAFDPFKPAAILRARPARLARLGLSAPKIRALKAIARAVTREQLALHALGDLAPEEAHAALTAVHGIGPWTADIYLLSCLGHADAWPAGDLALQEAARVAFGLRARPTAKEMQALAEPWRPWRAVAARILWTYYRTAAEAAKASAKRPARPKPSPKPRRR